MLVRIQLLITARPEVELLLACARLQLSDSQLERVGHLLAQTIDWPFLLDLARIHGLRPLLFRHLEAIGSAALPKAIRAELWARHQVLVRRNRAMADELKTILHLLDCEGIPALPYKGPMLALTAYGDLALREFGDLDLLLRPADVLPAKAALQAAGFRPEYPLHASVEAAFLRSRANYHLVMLRDQPRLMVELHWKTDPEFPVEPLADETWWRALRTERLGDQDVRCFSPEESVLVLILHGSKHFWASLGWLVDVAELIRRGPPLDWRWIIGRAESLHASRRLALGLLLLRGLLEVDLPPPASDWLGGQAAVRPLARQITDSLFDLGAAKPGAWQRLRSNFQLYERWPERIRHAFDVVLSPSLIEWSQWPLPRALFFLYPPMRLLRLLRKHGAPRQADA